jgi:hypothetical protein
MKRKRSGREDAILFRLRMATARPNYVPTDRDLAVLAALDRCPLTAPQLLKLSGTFDHPFSSERSVRERLFALCRAGLAHAAYYATDTGGGTRDRSPRSSGTSKRYSPRHEKPRAV